MAERGRINYFEASKPASLVVGSAGLELRRAGVGRHFYLRWLAAQIIESPYEKRVAFLKEYLETGGVENPSGLGLAEIVEATRALRALNSVRGSLAWDEVLPEEPYEEQPTDYVGRGLARIVDVLARNYGWSREAILELPPEVALAHMQECILADRRRREWEHGLAEVSWEYDDRDKKRHYRPLAPIPWEQAIIMRKKYPPVPQAHRDKYFPKGVIIDLTKEENVRSRESGSGVTADETP